MIKSNELKIGNRFNRELHEIGQRGLVYDTDFVLTEEFMGKLFGGDNSIALQDLFPIPLTPEILEQCGFVKTDINEWSLKFAEHFSIEKSEVLMDDGFILLGYEHSHRTIKYLHQLQNLVMALTNTELEFSL